MGTKESSASSLRDPLGDAGWLGLFDLEHAGLQAARAAAQRGDISGAAGAVLASLSVRPMQAYISREDMLQVVRELAADAPAAVEESRRYVEMATAQTPRAAAAPYAGAASFLQLCDFDREVQHYASRGRGWYHLGLLYAATGEERWVREAEKLLAALPAYPEQLAEGAPSQDPEAFQPVLPWHPNCPPGFDCLGAAHILQNLAVTLPVFWPAWPAPARRRAVAYLARHADILFRGMRNDPPYNIPFHGLVAAWGVAALLPQLKGARRWKELLDRAFAAGGRYASHPYGHPEGFHGEHVGYQVVNQMLLTRCFLLYERSGGGTPELLRRQVEAGFEFAALTVLPDGSSFLVGDQQGRSMHENELEYHESLHLGAALFDRPDWKARAGGLRGTWPEGILALFMGPAGYRRWRAMPGPDLAGRTHLPAALPRAGFFHLKAGRGIETSCHGLLAAALSPNHGHHDCLSLDIFGCGRELISDSGFLGYGLAELARQQNPAAHAVLRVGHLAPRGPRHEEPSGVKLRSFRTSACGRLQAALAEHNLYENYLARRVLILCLPEGPEHGAGFWLVWDRLVHAGMPSGAEPPVSATAPAPARVTETLFPLHAPGGEARVEGLSGWSRHAPQDRLRRSGEKEPLGLTSAEGCAGLERADGAANIQVTALPVGAPGATIGLNLEEGFCGHFGTPVARPVLSCKWRGRIPHEAAYVLLPFRGVAEAPPGRVEGVCPEPDAPGSFEAHLEARDERLRGVCPEPVLVRAAGLAGKPGQDVRIEIRVGNRPAVLLEFSLGE